MRSATYFRGAMVGLILLSLTAIPFTYYRWTYQHSKRLRVVDEGKFYRSGCLTGAGLREAIQRYGIKTVINLMEENPDPMLAERPFERGTVRESDICKELGADYRFVVLDLLPGGTFAKRRPEGIDHFLTLMDACLKDPNRHPVLIHCRAGLHRTGCLTAVYRMEYDGWSVDQAMEELKGNGFGNRMATSFNDYIVQYILTYQAGIRNPVDPEITRHTHPVHLPRYKEEGFDPTK